MASSPRERLHPTRHPIRVFGRRSWSSIAHAWISLFLAGTSLLVILAVGNGLLRMVIDGELPASIEARWYSPEGEVFPDDASELLHPHGRNEVRVRVRAKDAPLLSVISVVALLLVSAATACALIALILISSGFASASVFSRGGGRWLRRFAVLLFVTPTLGLLAKRTVANLEEAYVKSLDVGQEVSLYLSRPGGPAADIFGLPMAFLEFMLWTVGAVFFFLLGTALMRAANAEQIARETV